MLIDVYLYVISIHVHHAKQLCKKRILIVAIFSKLNALTQKFSNAETDAANFLDVDINAH